MGEVFGRVTLSRVHPSLAGLRWVIVAPCSLKAIRAAGERAGIPGAVKGDGEDLVVADAVGAGTGQLVAFSEGGEAAMPYMPEKKPVDAHAGVLLDQVTIHEVSQGSL